MSANLRRTDLDLPGLRRRGFAAALGGSVAIVAMPMALATSAAVPDDQDILSTDTPAVDTTFGRIRGYRQGGIHTFKGVPYAASSAGQARFRPPSRHVGWKGVRSTLTYGPTCPQAQRWRNNYLAFVMDWNDGYPGEDCLHLNIWTPALAGDTGRPVMVWLHGGGFYAGSSYELPAYEGRNLSLRGDVVVVSVNHRVGPLAYMNLGPDGGADHSANAGMLDLVAALEWVRDNIAGFGGDPGNVTLFGQSAGGWKINTLTVMPAAKGLFHKAIVQSGSLLRLGKPEETMALASATARELDLDGDDPKKLVEVPAATLIEAAGRARKRMAMERSVPLASINWQPTVDGQEILSDPFDTDRAAAVTVPMIIGTTMHEKSPSLVEPDLENLTLAQVEDRLAAQLGDRAGKVVAAYREAHPQAEPVELLALITSPRTDAITQAERQVASGGTCFLYWFGWKTPVLDGRPRAFHCADLPFVFDNTDRCANVTGGGEGPRQLAARMSDAWIAFARHGQPSHPDLPDWPAFAPDRGQTMIFDDRCIVADDPDRAERLVLEAANQSAR